METGILEDSEALSRFITFRGWFRQDQSLRPDGFIPHPYPDLSVSRQKGLTVEQLWAIGNAIAALQKPSRTLYGRADLTVGMVRAIKLSVVSQPVPENENHAAIIDWPNDKPAQKLLAQELAAAAKELIPYHAGA